MLPKLALLFIPVMIVQAVIQEIIFYNQDGNYFGFHTHIANAKRFDFGNVTKVCAKGAWVIYLLPDFEETLFGLAYGTTLRCWNQNISCMSSFRYLGGLDTDTEGISFYADRNFEGPELHVDTIAYGGMSSPINSLAITGASDWTVYAGTNFNGSAECFRGSKSGIVYMTSLKTSLPQIGSVLKGCSKTTQETDD
ncbi:unnamed protein product [Allacma fusca]|uniref:Uncharacterized protein n=1 Tax=Allacma fusca TaxID=39272 RepID=A0A8J2KI31_9HEXA|nr:unnamed protein product [Allacma fusca]